MRAPALRIAVFVAALAAIGAGSLLLGRAVNPADQSSAANTHAGGSTSGMPGMAGHGSSTTSPLGLASTAAGLTIVPETTSFAAGRTSMLRFRIVDDSGQPVTQYQVELQRLLHLIVVRRDMSGFQHLHPLLDASGTWRVPLTLLESGSYHILADFVTGGQRNVLGFDVQARGAAYVPHPLPKPPTTVVVDGLTVKLGTDRVLAGQAAYLSFQVEKQGNPVKVDPYLGADGHLVVLREGDMAYLHAHPEDEGERGPIRFMVDYPSTGRYRLFLQFKSEGKVHTAAFTQEVD